MGTRERQPEQITINLFNGDCMAFTSNIETHYVEQFQSNVFHLAQQEASFILPHVRRETQNAKMKHYDFYDKAPEPQLITTKFSPTEYGSITHGRRACFIADYDLAIPVWDQDKLRMIHEPQSEYAKSMKMAWARKWDKDLIAFILADTTREGENGETSVSYPNSQKMVAHDGATTTGVRLNSNTLTHLNTKIADTHVYGEILFIGGHKDREGMLSDDKVINGDYNTIKALVEGKIDTYQGFRFVWVPTDIMLKYSSNKYYNPVNGDFSDSGGGAYTGTVTAAKSRRCVAYEKNAVIFAIAEDLMTRIDDLPERRYTTQIYMKMTYGGTRLEDKRVFELVTSDL